MPAIPNFYLMKRTIFFITLLIFCFNAYVFPQQAPKREFRGAWIQTVFQPQYQKMDRDRMQCYFIDMLDKLQKTGINAVIFQVRPMADAFYPSDLEPWSRFLTGQQGKAPSPFWDPMKFLIDECHARNMEFHAWLNPYRVASQATEPLAVTHIAHKHPEWLVQYGKQLVFDPGLPGPREFICDVVKDIVKRYDVDAIHMDDYFYPYPVNGMPFPDDASYAKYGKGTDRNTWRRNNVNILIEELNKSIKHIKPWVRFGISPFGIYRNAKSDPDGSDTNGLQNYDDLYADVLLWTRMGWIDYLLPQLYWEIGHKAACSEKLIYWWNRHANGRHLYIGQDVKRTLNAPDYSESGTQLERKMQLNRSFENISGICFWPASELIDNYGNIDTYLQDKYFTTPALIPAYTRISDKTPKEVRRLKARWTSQGYVLEWKQPRGRRNKIQYPVYYCIYRFRKDEPVNLSDPSHIQAITRDTGYKLPYLKGNDSWVYIVTSVDRIHNESKKGKKKVVRL